jgi:hypothetical protein
MRLGPWVLVSLIAAAIVLVVLAVGDAAAPSSCTEADESIDGELFTQAERKYRAILAEEPENDCAQDGMDEVAEALCARADELVIQGASSPAVGMYRRILAFEPPPPDRTIECAVDGIANMQSDDPGSAAEAPR